MGLQGSKQRRKQIIQDKVSQVLIKYMDEIASPSCVNETGNTDLEIIAYCVDYCVQLGCTDLLFGKLWDMVSEVDNYKAVYLRALENPIIDGLLDPQLPPAIVQQLVTRFEQENRLDSLQAIIIQLNIECLDIHQVNSIKFNLTNI